MSGIRVRVVRDALILRELQLQPRGRHLLPNAVFEASVSYHSRPPVPRGGDGMKRFLEILREWFRPEPAPPLSDVPDDYRRAEEFRHRDQVEWARLRSKMF